MSNYVLKYKRENNVKYISHLDFVRMFHRAVRRSGLTMSFSQGFNPHPIMTVAMPLSVGVTSSGEYMKIGFEKEPESSEIINALNSALPPGFEILDAVKCEGKEYDFKDLDRARYTVMAELSDEHIPDIEKFLKNDKILVMKKSKSGIKEADIRPYIYDLKILKAEGREITFSMVVAAGNNYNLKPETLLDAITNYDPDFKAEFVLVHREEILKGEEKFL